MKSIARGYRLTFPAVLGMAALGCGSNAADDEAAEKPCARGEALVARPEARIFLSSSFLPRLNARRAAGEPAWTELAKTCDGLASGTIYPPNGTAYPNPPNLGQGYQGEEYLPAIAALGLCYRTTSGSDEAAATRYAAAGARVLEAMSTPVASGGQPPQTDWGYGIRNYGVGMALGYDWLYPALSASTRQRVIASLNAWIDWYDQSGFIRNDPIGNYFVGYLLAKALTALATEGENSKAPSYWSDVSTRLWATLVKPAFSRSMTGGGWPEGWGYGPRAVLGVAELLWAVKTAKGLDWGMELPQARDQAQYLTYFAWPSLLRMDDHGTVRSGNALKPSTALVSGLATILQRFADPASKQAVAFGADILAAAGDDRAAWQKFLYGDPALPKETYTTRPLSYQASGPGHVAMRSSWQKTGVWAALESGPYINAPDSGEQMFNAGSLSVVIGNSPILINATGWLPSVAGTAGEDFVYQDSWSTGSRRLYNTFFVDDPVNPHNPGQSGTGPSESNTHVERYEDRGPFVRVRAAQVEDQYASSVSQFSRELVYMRPGTFVLFDRTTVARAGADQWLAFHTPALPARQSSSDSTQTRYDVSSPAGTGNIRFLLPRQLSTKTVSLPGSCARLEAHAAGAAEQQWLTVIGAGETAAHVRLSAEDGNLRSGDLVGVHVRAVRNQVVLFSKGHAPSSTISSAEYDVSQSADSDHVLVDVAPAPDGYAASVVGMGGALRVKVTRGGPLRASSVGTLHFVVTQSGAVDTPPEPPPPPGTGGSSGTGSGGSGGTGGGGASGTGQTGGAGGTGSAPDDRCKPNPCSPPSGQGTASKPDEPPRDEPAPPETLVPTEPPANSGGSQSDRCR